VHLLDQYSDNGLVAFAYSLHSKKNRRKDRRDWKIRKKT